MNTKIDFDEPIEYEFTEGPWETIGEGVFSTNDSEIVYGKYLSRSADPEERKANARLIAAAPAMFEALAEILRCRATGGYGADGYQGMKMAAAALEQALGVK